MTLYSIYSLMISSGCVSSKIITTIFINLTFLYYFHLIIIPTFFRKFVNFFLRYNFIYDEEVGANKYTGC